MRVLSLLSLLFIGSSAWYYGRPDPGSSTQGGVWPLPWTIQYDTYNHTINPKTFVFTTSVPNCEVMTKAISRYQKLSFPLYNSASYSDSNPTLTSLVINIPVCDTGFPQLESDESYQLKVTSGKNIATLTANTVWGALRGMESFSQLIYQPSANKDLMAQNKMNVLHWHLVDSEAFPYTSLKFPNLTLYGAYSPAHVYSIADIKKVIDYARLRGIRVIPEFDTPGHTGAWGYGITNLTSLCYNTQGFISEMSNIIDATWKPNYDFLRDFFTEALNLFQDNYMHFGGDEVSYDMKQCWYNNPQVRQRMTEQGFGSDTGALLNYYWQQIFQIVDNAKPGAKKIVWQEVLDLNVKADNTIAHVWKGDNYSDAMNEMATVTKNGHRAILSSCWYLNYIKYGADWGYVNNVNMRDRGMYYECDPTDFTGTAAQKALVMGGEAAMWGEFVDATNLIQRYWPRASAVAERLWSDPTQTFSADNAWPRLHEFRCRMMNRGFPAEPPNDPDFCPFEWNPNYTEL